MRSKQVLALLSEQERKFDRERAAWRDERERLLDRIMVLAEKPPLDMAPFQQMVPDDPDVVPAEQELGDDLYEMPTVTATNGATFVWTPPTISPRERMLREDG